MALLSDYINNQKPKTQQAETAAAPSKGLLSSFVEKSGVQPAKKTAAPMFAFLAKNKQNSFEALRQPAELSEAAKRYTADPLRRLEAGTQRTLPSARPTVRGIMNDILIDADKERTAVPTTDYNSAEYGKAKAAYESAKRYTDQLKTGAERAGGGAYAQAITAAEERLAQTKAAFDTAEKNKNADIKTRDVNRRTGTLESLERDAAGSADFAATSVKSLADNYKIFQQTDRPYTEENEGEGFKPYLAFGIQKAPWAAFMTDKEKSTYAYWLAKDKNKAQEYWNALKPALNYRKQTDDNTLIENASEKYPAFGVAANITGSFLSPAALVGTAGHVVKDWVTGEETPVDPNSSAFGGAHMVNSSASGIKKNVETPLGGFLVDTGLSMAQFVSKLPLGAAALPLMASGAGGMTALEVTERGGTAEQALYMGLVSAAAEYFTEKISLDNLIGIYKAGGAGFRQGLKTAAINAARQGGVEFSEELLSEYINNIGDELIMGQASNMQAYVRELVSAGMSQEDALRKAAAQYWIINPLIAGAGGMLSGLAMGTGGSVAANISQAAQQAKPEATKPTVFYTGSSNPNITEFKAGGDGNTKQSGDSFGVGVYLTDNPDVAKLYAQGDSGKVYTVSTDSDLLSLEDKATPKFVKTVAESISDAPKQYRNRILRDVGRVKESFSDVNAAQDFYDKADEEWKKEDGQYSGNRPTVNKQGNVFTIEYTDYGSDLQNLLMQSTNRQLFEAIAAINTNDASGLVMASGYDGITYHDGGAFNSGIEGNTAVVYRNTHRIKQVDEAIKPETQSPSLFPENSLGAKITSGMPKGTGAAEQGFVPTTEYDTWSQNTENGKFHDVGENPVRSVDLPKVNPQGENTMKTAATVMESQNTPDARVREIQQALVDGDMGYIPIANEKLAAQADAKVKRNGWQTSLTDWTAQVRSGKVNPQLVAEGAILLNNAANAPECTKEAYINLLTDYANLNHASGQALQAARILKKLSPEGKLYAMQRSVQSMVEEYSSKNKTVDIKLDAELADKYRKATTDAERDAIVSEIQQNIADQLPSTGLDKWTALRYVNMLGNFKTQIRNVAGNTTMLLVTKAKNEVAAALELIANKASGGKFERTKSFTNGKGLYRAAYADFKNVQSAAMGEGKYSQSNAKSEFEKGIEEKKTIFKANGDWGKKADSNIAAKGARAATDVGFKVLEAYRNITNRAMEQGDVIFSRVTYADALAGYLKVHAVSAQQLTNGQVDTALLDRARLFAIKEAQEATFRDTNAFSSAVSNFDRGWSKGGQVFSKGIMPFRKTPANIAVRAEEYSLLGAINTAVKAVQLAKGAENVSGADVINSLSKTLTGSGIMMLGWALKKSGLLRGKEDDEKQKAFDQLTGQQDYSITIGGVSFTLDWLTPASMPLFVGAALYDLTAENGIKPNDIESALTSIADPIISMSMMSGVNDALSNIKYSDNNLLEFAAASAMNYLTQGVTNTLLGQVERTVEKTRMATYKNEDSLLPGGIQRNIGKASAKILGWDFNQGEYVDAWGRTQNNGSLAEKIGINFLSPAYISKPKETALVNELERLYDATGNSSVVPKRMTDREFDSYNGTYTMTVQEQVAFQKTRGQYAFKELSALTESADYKAMSDEDKAKAVAAVQEQATLTAKQSVVEARGGMFIPSTTANDKISEYTAAGISKKQAYDLYKTVSQISTTDSAEKRYETIRAIGQQGYTDKQAIAVAATLYTTHDEDTGEVNKQSMLPYLATSKRLLSLYLNTKDSEMVSMAVPVSFSDKKVEYVLTATEKELFQFAYAKEFNAWTNNLSTAEDVKKYRDKAYGFAKSVIIQYRQSGG